MAGTDVERGRIALVAHPTVRRSDCEHRLSYILDTDIERGGFLHIEHAFREGISSGERPEQNRAIPTARSQELPMGGK